MTYTTTSVRSDSTWALRLHSEKCTACASPETSSSSLISSDSTRPTPKRSWIRKAPMYVVFLFRFFGDRRLNGICSYLVFHGGSGSSTEEISTAVGHGVIKMNVDTDTQFVYLVGIRVCVFFSLILFCLPNMRRSCFSRTSSSKIKTTSWHK